MTELVEVMCPFDRLRGREFLAPEVEGRLGLRILCKDILSQTVGIVGSSLRDRILLDRLAEHRQSLDHQPCRIIGIFEGHLTLRSISRHQGGDINGLRTRLMLGDRHRHRDALCSRQYGQVVLLAIAEVLSTHGGLTDQERNIEL